MEKYIIEDFKRDYPDLDFPCWEKVSPEETNDIIDKFFKQIHIANNSAENKLEKLYSCMNEHPLSPLKYENLNFNILLEKINVEKPEFILINWYRMETLDKMRYQDFQKYFFDIWYGNEDIEIFSSNLDWVIALTHYDLIKFIKPPLFKV